MPNAISNTSPLLYLHRIKSLKWLPSLFGEVWIPGAVVFDFSSTAFFGFVIVTRCND
jgi:predicted nucleic acid-binding protein